MNYAAIAAILLGCVSALTIIKKKKDDQDKKDNK